MTSFARWVVKSQNQRIIVNPIRKQWTGGRFLFNDFYRVLIIVSFSVLTDQALSDLWLSVRVNSYGHVGMLSPFHGTFIQHLDVMTPKCD